MWGQPLDREGPPDPEFAPPGQQPATSGATHAAGPSSQEAAAAVARPADAAAVAVLASLAEGDTMLAGELPLQGKERGTEFLRALHILDGGRV